MQPNAIHTKEAPQAIVDLPPGLFEVKLVHVLNLEGPQIKWVEQVGVQRNKKVV